MSGQIPLQYSGPESPLYFRDSVPFHSILTLSVTFKVILSPASGGGGEPAGSALSAYLIVCLLTEAETP